MVKYNCVNVIFPIHLWYRVTNTRKRDAFANKINEYNFKLGLWEHYSLARYLFLKAITEVFTSDMAIDIFISKTKQNATYREHSTISSLNSKPVGIYHIKIKSICLTLYTGLNVFEI